MLKSPSFTQPSPTTTKSRTMPARGGRRLGEAQRQFVAGIHDHVAIVDRAEQRPHVAEARVIALEIEPARRGALDDVARPLGRARPRARRCSRSRDSAVRADCSGSRCGVTRHVGPPDRPRQAIPEDLQVGRQPHAARTCRGQHAVAGRSGPSCPCPTGKPRLACTVRNRPCGVRDLEREAARRRVRALARSRR